MKKTVIQKLAFIFSILVVSVSLLSFSKPAPKQQFFAINIYFFNQKSQEESIDNFLKQAFIPALQRAGIEKVGVFKPVESDSAFGKRIYVFIPFSSLEQFSELNQIIEKDRRYLEAGKDYLNATNQNPPFFRIESILLKAFSGMPSFKTPVLKTQPSERIYELRSYESATEKLASKKREMFNSGGEISIFGRLGFNPVFYGEVLSGKQRPNLMYMTTFENKVSHDEHWKSFSNDMEWKKLSSLEEFKNTVSKSQVFLLHPTDYSDI